MNRRTFIQCIGGVAAVAAPMSFSIAADKARIPIGFLGASHSHGPAKVQLAMNSPDWEFVGVCDSTAAGRQSCEKLGAQLISQDELLAKARVIAVESDVRDHAAHALLALKAGKHVHLEKPLAAKLSDVQAVIALAREKKLLLQTGYMWRHNPGFKAIFEAVSKGWLGDVYMVRAYICNFVPAARRPEWGEFPGGSMFELGAHLVDATVRLLGKPKAVTPFLRHHGKFADSLKDNNVAVLEYEKATAIIINTALQSASTPQRSFEVLGTKGTAILQPIEPPTLSIDLTAAAGPYKKGLQKIEMPVYKRYEADFAELAAAVRGECSLCVDFEQEAVVAETVLRVGEMR